MMRRETMRRGLDVIATVFEHFGLVLRVACAGALIVMVLHQEVVDVPLQPIP